MLPTSRIFRLNFVGDVMLGRLIDQLLPTHVACPEDALQIASFVRLHPELQSYGFRTPWGNTLPLFHTGHLNLINLETSATTNPKPWPNKVFNYRMHPENIQCLKEAQIDYVSLANNHTLDFSEEGLVETVKSLKSACISFAGAGESREEALRPAVLRLPQASGESELELVVHVYSASDHPRDWSRIHGFNFIDYCASTRSRLKALLTGSPRVDWPQLKIFSVHWGPNYAWHPSDQIRNLAHYLIDECGVDIVHGHSSHHIQGVEVYKGKIIIYGCGDFVDDYAVDNTYRNDLSGIWRVLVEERKENRESPKIKRLELFPTRIKSFQANLLESSDRDHKWVQTKLIDLSRQHGTKVESKLGDEGQIVVHVEVNSAKT